MTPATPDRSTAEDAESPELSWRLVKPDGRAPGHVAFEEKLVAFFLDSGIMLGVPKSLAAIYGICFASPEALSFSDVHDRLNLSAGSISQGLRILRELGALKVVAVKGDRREFFTPDLELRKLIVHYLDDRLGKQLDSGRGKLRATHDAVPYGGSDSTRILKARLEALETWHEKARSLMPMVKIFLKLT